MDALIESFATLQQTLFEAWVQPLVFGMGQGHLLDKAFEGAGWLVVGLLQLKVAKGLVHETYECYFKKENITHGNH